MMEKVKENTGRLPRQMSADSGYFSIETVTALIEKSLDVYIPPNKIRHSNYILASPRGRTPNDLSIEDRMRRKLRTKKERKCYGLRKELPEPVFGQIKQVRGFRQLLFRGLEKVSGEWKFICSSHNLLKLFGAWIDGMVTADLLASET